jgi:hypothetical protein
MDSVGKDGIVVRALPGVPPRRFAVLTVLTALVALAFDRIFETHSLSASLWFWPLDVWTDARRVEEQNAGHA